MSERQRSLRRMVALQEKAKTIAAAKLAVAEGHKAALAGERTSLQSFIEGADLTGRLAVMAIGATRTLVAREADAETRRAALAAARQKVETTLKLAERVAATVARDERAVAERRSLEELIAAAVARQAGPQPD